MNEGQFRTQYESKRSAYESTQKLLEAFAQSAVEALSSPQPGKPAIRCRVSSAGIKTAGSLSDKATRQQPPLTGSDVFEKIYDIVRLSIICNNLNEVYSVVDFLKSEAKKKRGFRIAKQVPKVKREEDFIAKPRDNGYRAYHLIFEVSCLGHGWVPCEIQVKTLLQDSWGAFTHEDHYRRVPRLPQPGSQPSDGDLAYELFRALGDSLAATDQIAQQIRNAILRQEQLEWQVPTTVDIQQYAHTDEIVSEGSDDHESQVSAGATQTQDPEIKYKVGDVVSALVVHIPLGYYGAIAVLEDGTKGLCHISEISDDYVLKIEDYLEVGNTYDFIVLEVQANRRELQLSRKGLPNGPPSSTHGSFRY